MGKRTDEHLELRELYSVPGLNSVEQVRLRTRPHKVAAVLNAVPRMLPIVLIWLAFDVTFIVLMVVFFEDIFSDVPWILAFIIPFFIIHLIPVWIWLYNIFTAAHKAGKTEYVITDSKIYIKYPKGKSYKIDTIILSQIMTIDIKRGLFDRMCGVGDIYINAGTNYVLPDVPNTQRVYNIIKSLSIGDSGIFSK